ncbi:MAG: LysM peptidoglycan-binding domain-containing protein [Ardenticatenaceae bacterium]|nr:LysM peptidoglycan-binding domain-containing protein [Ardenticatenaceae bacterium]
MMKRVSWLLLVLLWWMAVGTAQADTAYVVQPGDTLFSIAQRFGVSVTAVVQANHLVNPNLIYAGSTLIIPDGAAPTNPTTPPPPTPATGTTYVVQPGDTIFRIAVRFGVSVTAVAQANGLSNPNLIFVGQTLIIPGGTQPTTPPPANPPPPTTGANLLPNPSFEGGWYHQNGIPELQLPNGWQFEYDEGDNPFDPQPWSRFVRPETRVLSNNFLPPDEQARFIWDGAHTVKIFKGSGAISFRLFTDVALSPGTYLFEVNIFPDLVADYENGNKVWASAGAGEVLLLGGNGNSGWQMPVVGQKNTLTYTFTITQAQTVRVGLAARGRYALANNGWFMDDWGLRRVN